MPPKLWRNNHTERRGVFNIDGGVRLVTVWMRSDLYEKMHTCDSCGREGIIYALVVVVLALEQLMDSA